VSDQSSAASFGCSGTLISGAKGEIIGTGAQNTLDIVSDCSTIGIAAEVCYSLVLNGYSDWFSPSYRELEAMYENRDIINSVSVSNGGFAMAGGYWTSTDYLVGTAYYRNFTTGWVSGRAKTSNSNVRAIRAF